MDKGTEEQKTKITLSDGSTKTIFYNLTIITLVEVSYQNMLQTRQVMPHTCIFFDKAINDKEITDRTGKKEDSSLDDDKTGEELHKDIKDNVVPLITKFLDKKTSF